MLAQQTDTIAAIATPIGEGGISVIRISGPDAISIARKGFRGKIDLAGAPTHSAHYGSFVDEAGQSIDDVVVVVFRRPQSYTGEDIAELSCHGGIFISKRMLQTVFNYGARLAEPGEFTKRAFLNGRIDLAQAEAVADLIHARSQAAHRSSLRQLKGGLSEKVNAIRDELIDIIGTMEVELDFVEEGYEFTDRSGVCSQLKTILSRITELASSYEIGRVYREGIKVVIAGAPNVGKSSLLNALLRQNRAIVTEIPGTTRDTIEESLVIEGLLFTVVDTAGLRETDDPIEMEGLRRTEEEVSKCGLVVLVFDCCREPTSIEVKHIGKLVEEIKATEKTGIGVMNKIDIRRPERNLAMKIAGLVDGLAVVEVSAKTSEGLDKLKMLLVDTALGGRHTTAEASVTVTNARHYESLVNVKESLQLALQSFLQQQSGEFVIVDLRSALDALGTITGTVTTEDILNSIFSKFCIGK